MDKKFLGVIVGVGVIVGIASIVLSASNIEIVSTQQTN